MLLDHRQTPVRADFLKLDADNRARRTHRRARRRLAGTIDTAAAGTRQACPEGRARLPDPGRRSRIRCAVLRSRRREEFIEVKTTREQKEFPFLITRSEAKFSIEGRTASISTARPTSASRRRAYPPCQTRLPPDVSWCRLRTWRGRLGSWLLDVCSVETRQ